MAQKTNTQKASDSEKEESKKGDLRFIRREISRHEGYLAESKKGECNSPLIKKHLISLEGTLGFLKEKELHIQEMINQKT